MSFAIEPIQPPIVPLSLFCSQSLRTTASASARRRTGPADGLRGNGGAGPAGAQILEVRELAELRRQRAVQVISPKAPATARGTASVPRGQYPSPSGYPRLIRVVP